MQNVAVTNYSVPKTLGAGEILRDILILFMLLKYLFCGRIDQCVLSFHDTFSTPCSLGSKLAASPTLLLPPGGPRGYKLLP